jgi:hypothetical protein
MESSLSIMKYNIWEGGGHKLPSLTTRCDLSHITAMAKVLEWGKHTWYAYIHVFICSSVVVENWLVKHHVFIVRIYFKTNCIIQMLWRFWLWCSKVWHISFATLLWSGLTISVFVTVSQQVCWPCMFCSHTWEHWMSNNSNVVSNVASGHLTDVKQVPSKNSAWRSEVSSIQS